MMIELVVSFLCGSVLTFVILLVAILFWFYSHPLVAAKRSKLHSTRTYTPPRSPPHIEDVYDQLKSSPDGLGEESCVWFNLIVDFLFKELRDTPRIKRLVMKKIEKEFQELLLTKTEGRMLEQLTVREYFLGVSMPVITSAAVVKVERSTDNLMNIEEIEIALEVEYTGECEMAIDADLLFNKAAYVAIQIKQIKGRGRLKFTRQPVTSWSFTFYEEPYLDLKVDSHFEGRDFPQLSSFIKAQCRKYVRRKHTLPASKIRYKPFFQKHKPQDQLLDLHVHDHRLTVGKLLVEVVKCSRLPHLDGARMVYCTVGVTDTPWKTMIHLWKTQWPVFEFVVSKTVGQAIGMKNRKVVYEDEDESNVFILVSDIIPLSAADTAGLKKGDIVTKVNNVKINSVKQVTRLINKTKGRSVLITVNRPPAHFSAKLLHSEIGNQYSIPTVASPADDSMSAEALRDASTVSNNFSRSGSQDGASSHLDRGSNGCEETPGEGDNHSRPRHNEVDVESFHGGSVDNSLEEGSSTERREGRQLRKRHPPTAVTSGDEVNNESEDLAGVDHDRDIILPGPSSPSSSHSLPHPHTGDDSELATQSQDTDVADSTSTQMTRAVSICKNPEWNQEHSFEVGENHNYVNVCVWVKLNEERGNLLIGHVTLSLTDIALECLCTGSGTHQQNYVLVAAEAAKAYVSRAALQATNAASGKGLSGKDEKIFAGDVFLRFTHVPSFSVDHKDKGEHHADNIEPQHNLRHSLSTPSDKNTPRDHNFIGVEVDGLHRKCYVCTKKIWVLKSKVQECQKCGIKCHKKCISYCMKNVPCHEKPPVSLHQISEGEFTIYEREKEDEDVYGGNGHRLLDQQRKRINSAESSSFVVLESTELRYSEEEGSEAGEDVNVQPKIVMRPDSGSESENDHNVASKIPEEMRNMSWYPNLPQREQALKDKIDKLQEEIERLNNLMEEEKSRESSEISSTERDRIKQCITQYDEKLTPLYLLLAQLNVELNECSSETDSPSVQQN